MSLSIHVGTLTAYFAPAIRAAGEFDPPPTDDDVRARILEWREWVGSGLREKGHLKAPLDWDETRATHADVPLDVDDLRALKLLLAYAGQQGVLPPAELPAAPERDPRWIEAAANDFRDSDYATVLVPEFWLPGEFDFTFPCPYPDGHETQTGSVGALSAQLARACVAQLGGSTTDCAAWLARGAGDSGLRGRARRAAAILWNAAETATRDQLPMLLHP